MREVDGESNFASLLKLKELNNLELADEMKNYLN
jgi:hypothetical protein